ncbi:MAG: isoleucine--tRNA ligase [Parcubacteria group bacterium]|jgi:isoleucyl-tRNA synthetase
MAFKKVDARQKYSQMEEEVIEFWREDKTFEKSVSARDKKDSYVFYDGPPFITGVPHYGTLLSSIVKDVVPRYWTMKGKRVERRWGWDCHGLPAENLVEKKLGIKDKRDVAKIGLEKYIETCRSEMVQGGNEWESTIERIGRWVEFKNAYKTMDKEYMESVWWAFKALHEKGKIYEGEKVLMYCTRCATPISKAEVAMDNSYKVVTDPSVYVKFKLEGEENTYLLAWTTTPWTLSANVALAVNPNLKYVKLKFSRVTVNNTKINIKEQDTYIVEENRAKTVFGFDYRDASGIAMLGGINGEPLELDLSFEYKIISGSDLINKRYKPLFVDHGENSHKIIAGEFVTTEDGTGIVHIAPAFGEDDYAVAKKEKLPVVNTVDENGDYINGRWAGKNVWEVNKEIAKTLLAEGVVMKIDYVQHEYPHCHRCATKLMYRAHPSWFMNIDEQKSEMLAQNKNINWFPQHFKEKRFKNTIETAPDWNLSRDRFWATPIPVWRGEKSDGTVVTKVVGSYQELKELSGAELSDYHLPYVDKITFELDGVKMKRVEKVMDCWFESGSMPFAQFHYPFENREKFEENFPGDFISEYVGQVRAWFYYLHAISVGLFGKEAFKNVIVTGTIAGADGKKMSKSLGNYTDSNILLDQYSADALRYLLINSPLLNGEDFILTDKDVSDVQRKLGTLWQSYSFFVMYANVDKFEVSRDAKFCVSAGGNLLDRWIVSKLHELIKIVDENMLAYDLPNATKPIMDFIDNLSNWYIRRSRKRFWKSENDGDKNEAYATLHYVLVTLSKLMAPFTPFIAEEIFRNLSGAVETQNFASVHLQDFPIADEKLIDEKLNEEMREARIIISLGLQLRADAKIKVRQPLEELRIMNYELKEEFQNIIKEELNIKSISFSNKSEKENLEKDGWKVIGRIIDSSNTYFIALKIEITPELKLEGQAREVIRFIQEMRKEAGFEVDNRIEIVYSGKSKIFNNIDLKKLIAKETLANGILSSDEVSGDLKKTFEVDGEELEIGVKKI